MVWESMHRIATQGISPPVAPILSLNEQVLPTLHWELELPFTLAEQRRIRPVPRVVRPDLQLSTHLAVHVECPAHPLAQVWDKDRGKNRCQDRRGSHQDGDSDGVLGVFAGGHMDHCISLG